MRESGPVFFRYPEGYSDLAQKYKLEARKLLGYLNLSIRGPIKQPFAATSKRLRDGTILKAFHVYGKNYVDIIPVFSEQLIDEFEQKFIFSCEWRTGYWSKDSDYTLAERSEFKRWEPKTKELLLRPQLGKQLGIANWYSVSGATRGAKQLSWVWYDQAFNEGARFPYCSTYGDTLLWVGSEREPSIDDAPDAIRGACYCGPYIVIATINSGLAYRKNGSWIQVSGSSSLFDNFYWYGYWPVRFSGSGTKGVCVGGSQADDNWRKLEFEISYDEGSDSVELVGSSESIEWNYSGSVGTASYSSNPTSSSYMEYEPPATPSYPPLPGLDPGEFICDQYIEHTYNSVFGHPEYGTFIAGTCAVTKYGKYAGANCNQTGGFGVLSNCNGIVTLKRHFENTSSESMSAVGGQTELLIAADYDGDDLVELFVRTDTYNHQYTSSGTNNSVADYLPFFALRTTDGTQESQDAATRSEVSYFVVKKNGSHVYEHKAVDIQWSELGTFSRTYHIEHVMGGTDTNARTHTYAKSNVGSTFKMMAVDLRTQTIIGVNADLSCTVSSGPWTENIGESSNQDFTSTTNYSWNRPNIEILTPAGFEQFEVAGLASDSHQEIGYGIDGFAEPYFGWSNGQTIPSYEYLFTVQNIEYCHNQVTPRGDILFSIDSNEFWFDWAELDNLGDLVYSGKYPESIMVASGIWDARTRDIYKLKDLHPDPIPADTGDAEFKYQMIQWDYPHTTNYVAFADWLMCHSNS